MPDSPPSPPPGLSDDVADALAACSPALLSAVATYAEELAAYRDAADDTTENDDPDWGTDDRPDDVPAKATLTVKNINDNRYYYWQWREGETVKSKYKGPANGDGR